MIIMKTKKGAFEQSTVILMVLLLVAIVVMLPFYWEITEMSKGVVNGGWCGMSVTLASFKAEGVACVDIVTSPTGLNCPRRNVEISEKEINVAFKSKKDTEVKNKDGLY